MVHIAFRGYWNVAALSQVTRNRKAITHRNMLRLGCLENFVRGEIGKGCDRNTCRGDLS